MGNLTGQADLDDRGRVPGAVIDNGTFPIAGPAKRSLL